MTRYITGIIAVVIAIGAVAFKAPKADRNFADITFYYTSTNYSSGEVVKKTNWSSTVTPPTCVGLQYKACKLVIDQSQTTLDGSGNRILSNDIQAMPGAGGATNGNVPNPTTTGYVSRNDKP